MGEFHVVVDVEPGAGGDQFADDDVLLEAGEGVDLALDGGVGEDPGGLLEGGRREEAVGGQGGLGDAQQHRDVVGLLQADLALGDAAGNARGGRSPYWP